MTVRRTPSVLVLAGALLLTLATACGGSSGGTGAKASSPSAAPAPSPLDAAAAHRVAVAAQVAAGDLPGYKEDASAGGDADAPDAADKEFQACISGAADPNYLADVTSSDFTKASGPVSQLTVSSEVQVVATPEQGRAEFATLQKPATLACLNAALKKLIAADAPEGATFTGELTRVPTTAPAGADGASRFRFAGVFKVQGVAVNVTADLELLLVGRAEVTLNELSVGDLKLTDADRVRLLTALTTRAVAAQK